MLFLKNDQEDVESKIHREKCCQFNSIVECELNHEMKLKATIYMNGHSLT